MDTPGCLSKTSTPKMAARKCPSLMLLLFCSALIERACGYGVGGIRDVAQFQQNAYIQRLARFSVHQFNKQQNGDLSLSKVVKAQKQVVAGIMYYLTIEAVDGHRTSGFYAAKILHISWRNVTQLKEFKRLHNPPTSANTFSILLRRKDHFHFRNEVMQFIFKITPKSTGYELRISKHP